MNADERQDNGLRGDRYAVSDNDIRQGLDDRHFAGLAHLNYQHHFIDRAGNRRIFPSDRIVSEGGALVENYYIAPLATLTLMTS